MGDDASEEPRTKSSTFVVTHADDESAVLRDVHDAEVHTLSDPGPDGLATQDVLTATLRADPPMGVTWTLETVEDHRNVDVAESPESPTTLAQDLAEDQAVGDVTRQDRAGEGELHVLTVPEDQTEAAVADVLDDEEAVARAARLGVARVEIRAAPGLVCVRYMP